VLALLALVLMAAVGVSSAAGQDGDHDHDHDHDHVSRAPAVSRLLTWSNGVVLICAVLALLVLPPATLSATARQNRELVTSGRALDSAKALPLVGADPAMFSVKDWAALLSQGGPEAVLGKQVDLSGYVLDRGENDVFFIARLTVSCCAVDAQPIGVPAYRPGWREEIEPGGWITIQGAFVKNPSQDSKESVAIGVVSIAKIDEPDQPYVF
jgi:uncharacterized repeat protein (TIGR03943 family)